jgi:hypothetical protein
MAGILLAGRLCSLVLEAALPADNVHGLGPPWDLLTFTS